jgi:ferric-dicitrate binding protein FerR (iron transport regulator)
MEPTEKQVYQWFIEKLTGHLPPGDEAVLEEALSADPALRSRWETWMEEAREMDMSAFAGGLDAEAGLKDLKDRIASRELTRSPELTGSPEQADSRPQMANREQVHGRSPVKRLTRVMAAASALFIVLTGSYYLWFRPVSVIDKQKITALVLSKKPAVSLTLGNGRSVDLDAGKKDQTIRLAEATLNTGGDTLKYTSGDTAQNVLSVPAGGKYKVVLSDGTAVVLNAATTLRFPFRFSGDSREVYLEGEAYFRVAPDAHRPFIVHTPLTQVRVLGTSFDVNTYLKGKVRTALLEGKVLAIGNDGVTTALSPGIAADYDAAKGFVTGTFDPEDELSWMSGVYYFHDMRVADLAALASRCYGMHIIVKNDSLSDKSVTGLLETGKLLEFLNDLETTAHVKFRYSGNDLYFE